MQSKKEGYATCVYNEEHTMPESTLLWHYQRCPDSQRMKHLFKVCPYNTIHHIRYYEFEKHLQSCPDAPKIPQLNVGNDDPWG
ncbi:unnamed protein product [Blepharisma stoltei]|uniref:CHHC U11-48K-type domain-containing protein n=1 Tax=Blepharisma stoltei TaxID=1481888 RepID=A0AAU9K4N2_9CILI|nr:unnamed protein product [Blepharisma stoltei]